MNTLLIRVCNVKVVFIAITELQYVKLQSRNI